MSETEQTQTARQMEATAHLGTQPDKYDRYTGSRKCVCVREVRIGITTKNAMFALHSLTETEWAAWCALYDKRNAQQLLPLGEK